VDYSRLPAASVIVVGVGGLGTETARQLAQAGIGRLVLCDPDQVEMSNLSRGALFTPEQVGMDKVAAAEQTLRTLAPGTTVDARAEDFRYGIGLRELRAADLVLSCLDSATDRIALSSRCLLSGTRLGLLDAGLHPWGGEVRHYPPDGSCYACGCSPADRSAMAWHTACGRTEEMGASAPVTALVASWQASCAVRLLIEEEPGRQDIIRIDALAGESRRVKPRDPDPACPCHRQIEARYVVTTTLTRQSTVAELLALASREERVLSWNPIDRKDPLSPMVLHAAAPGARLGELGIPDAELLPAVRVRPMPHVRYFALGGSW
jgi:adenylyltransferase/sulfurtransferase